MNINHLFIHLIVDYFFLAGRMHVQMGANGKELLPQALDATNDQCSKPEQNIFCFKAG